MHKMINIEFDEYMILMDNKNILQSEITKLKKIISTKSEELKFIKDNSEEILVITKTDDGTKVESKRKENDAISDIVKENTKLFDKLFSLKNELEIIKEEFSLMKNEYKEEVDIVIDQKNKINLLSNNIKKIENRNLFQRILNKKIKY